MFFNIYMNDLSVLLNNSNIGGKIGGILVNHLDNFDFFELSWNDSTFKYL